MYKQGTAQDEDNLADKGCERMKRKKISFKNLIAMDKTRMLPWDFAASYIVTPVYLAACIVLTITFGVFMEMDSQKYLVHGLVCLGVFALLTAALLVSVPVLRKKTIDFELNRYDFDYSAEETREIYDFSSEETSLKFNKTGMCVDGKLYEYSRLQMKLETSNLGRRVVLWLAFSFPEEGIAVLPVAPTTLKMLEHFEIKLENEEMLRYILSNKKKAFRQIYSVGRIVR